MATRGRSDMLNRTAKVSRRFPELHTTRTFEIPACGTALVTEKNRETRAFFADGEAIFYDDVDQLIEKVKHYRNNPGEVERIAENGRRRVHEDGYDYESILSELLERVL